MTDNVIFGVDFKAKAEKEREEQKPLTGDPCIDVPENCPCETVVYFAPETDPA
jgi:hypothetical protein